MQTHVKILGAIHIVFGGLGVLAALIILAIFGGIAGLLGTAGIETHGAEAAIPVLGIIGTVLFVFLAVISIPGLVAGIGLLQFCNWARILTIVLSALHLLNFPFGTALGIYGLWVLLSQGTEQLFRTPR